MTTSTQPAKARKRVSPDLRRLVGSECVSLSGSAVSTVALPALAVLDLDASTTQIALLAFLGQLPSAIVALPGGAFSDRHAKRPLMIAADLTAAAVLVTIPAAAFAGVLGIYVVAVVLGIAKIVHSSASISYLPVLVEADLLQHANSRLGAASSVPTRRQQCGRRTGRRRLHRPLGPRRRRVLPCLRIPRVAHPHPRAGRRTGRGPRQPRAGHR